MDVDELEDVKKYSKNLKLLFVEDDEQSRDIICRLFLYFFDNFTNWCKNKKLR
ncbi:MAG: hypothetical protein U9N42_02905 [Campylobacterota bacterium]|nr:hypothetical protein [Campylobacterota bacterium]